MLESLDRLGQATAVSSADGKYVLLPSGTSVSVYGATTGARVRWLEGHTSRVTGVALHPHNTLQVYTSSLDGTIRLWDLDDGTSAKTIEVGRPVHHLVVPRSHSRLFYELEQAGPEKAGQSKAAAVWTYDLEAGRLYGSESGKPFHLQLNHLAPMVASEDGTLIGVADTRRLSVWRTSKGWKNPLKLHHTKHFTCLAIDAGQGRVAAGDESGRILIWHGVEAGLARAEAGALGAADKVEALGCTTVHWHAHPVRCLAFSLDSAYLLSGGEEAVLVAWQLGTNAKRILPRLNGQLAAICPLLSDAALFLVSQRDNTTRIINLASMKVVFSIYGVRRHPRKLPEQAVEQSAAAMLPGGGELLIAGDSDIIQIYDVSRDRHLEKLQVRPINVLTTFDKSEQKGHLGHPPPIEPQVSSICCSSDGSRMATLDVRPEVTPGDGYDTSLKFWERRASGATASKAPLYSVLDQFDMPHSGRVTGLDYHPSEDIAATVGSEGQLRLWALESLPWGATKGRRWRCRATTSYQGQGMHSAAFSADGSLLAVGTGAAITLWDATTAAFVATLPPPGGCHQATFRHLTFVPGTPYLAGVMGGSKDGLVVWNVLTAAVWWWLKLSVTCIAADGLGTGGLAVGLQPQGGFHQKEGSASPGSVALFNAASPKPLQVWLLPQSWAASLFFPPPSSPLFTHGLALAPEGTSPLLIFTHDRKFAMGRRVGVQQPAAVTEEVKQEQGDALGLTAYIRRQEGREAGTIDTSRFDTSLDTRSRVAALLDAPTHVLPPLESLAPAFLELLICEADDSMES